MNRLTFQQMCRFCALIILKSSFFSAGCGHPALREDQPLFQIKKKKKNKKGNNPKTPRRLLIWKDFLGTLYLFISRKDTITKMKSRMTQMYFLKATDIYPSSLKRKVFI